MKMSVVHISVLLVSCCSNVFLMEILLKGAPGCGNMITFCQFLFIAIEGFVFTSKFGTIQPVIPVRKYIVLVTLFFAVSVSTNCALNFDISMPLHMIFKSGSLVTNLLLSMLILKRRYSLLKYISVIMVTVGIFLATWESQSLQKKELRDSSKTESSSFIGLGLLSASLVAASWLGIYQETLFQKHGKHPREALFYSHALAIPGFAMLGADIVHYTKTFSLSAPVFHIPNLWLCLAGNVITQYVCVRSVFTLAASSSSLTVTMVITFRKFVSLMLSVVYFGNPFTTVHWAATALVFSGSLLFTQRPS